MIFKNTQEKRTKRRGRERRIVGEGEGMGV